MDESTREAAADLIDCLLPLNATARSMFGGYCVYIDGKPAGLVNDGRIFVKRSPAEGIMAGYAELAPAYPGARDSWLLPAGAVRDDPGRVAGFFAATADALPPPPPRRSRTRRRPA